MQRVFSCLGALTAPPAAALTVAMVAEGLFGWAAWVYWTLGVVGALAGLGVMVMAWDINRDSPESYFGEHFVGLVWVALCAGAVVLAAYDLGWSQIRRQQNWEDWQRASGRITEGGVTSFYRKGKDTPHFGHTTHFDFEFIVDGLKFVGSDRGSGQGAIGSAVHVWFNPRDPSQNVASLNSLASPLPARGVMPDYYLAAGLLAAISAGSIALARATPLRDGWWLPLFTALLIGGAYLGGAKLGEQRAVRRASFIEHPNPVPVDGSRNKELADLWHRSYSENLPAWRGRLPIQWMLALTDEEGKRREEAIDTIEAVTPADRDAIPVLLEILRSERAAPHAKRALMRIGSASVSSLITLANGPHPQMRCIATETLGEFPDDAATIVPVLGEVFAKRDLPLRLSSIRALAALARKNDQALSALIKHLVQTDPEHTQPAIIAEFIFWVGTLGPRAKAAESRLTELANDRRFQEGATKALQSIRGEKPASP